MSDDTPFRRPTSHRPGQHIRPAVVRRRYRPEPDPDEGLHENDSESELIAMTMSRIDPEMGRMDDDGAVGSLRGSQVYRSAPSSGGGVLLSPTIAQTKVSVAQQEAAEEAQTQADVEREKQRALERRRRWTALARWTKAVGKQHAADDASLMKTNANLLFYSGMIVPPMLLSLGSYAYYDYTSRAATLEAQRIVATTPAPAAAPQPTSASVGAVQQPTVTPPKTERTVRGREQPRSAFAAE